MGPPRHLHAEAGGTLRDTCPAWGHQAPGTGTPALCWDTMAQGGAVPDWGRCWNECRRQGFLSLGARAAQRPEPRRRPGASEPHPLKGQGSAGPGGPWGHTWLLQPRGTSRPTQVCSEGVNKGQSSWATAEEAKGRAGQLHPGVRPRARSRPGETGTQESSTPVLSEGRDAQWPEPRETFRRLPGPGPGGGQRVPQHQTAKSAPRATKASSCSQFSRAVPGHQLTGALASLEEVLLCRSD